MPRARPQQREPRERPDTPSESDTIEGRNPVLEALRAGRPMNKVLIAQGTAASVPLTEIIHLAREAGVVVERVDRKVLDRLLAGRRRQSVLAIAAIKPYASVGDILERARRQHEAPLLALLDGIEDPQNLGAIIRTAEAAGLHGLLVPSRRAAGLTGAVARASAGAVEHLPVARVSSMASAVARLSNESVWMVGINPGSSHDYPQVDYRQPTAIVVGAEGRGLSHLVKERCDVLVSIPMRGRVGSLNAGMAAGLVMYEALRQRRAE